MRIRAIFAALTLGAGAARAQCTSLPAGQTCVSVATLKIVGPGGYTDHVDIKPGYAANLSLVALDSTGKKITRHVVRWWTSDSAFATVSSGGRVTGLRYGSAQIFLQVGAQQTSVPVLVTPYQAAACGTLPAGAKCAAVADLTIVPPPVSGDRQDHADARVGYNYSMNFAAKDSSGNAIANHMVGWWTGTPSLDTVTAGGRLTGRAGGVGTVWLRVGLTLASLPVCVSPVEVYYLLPTLRDSRELQPPDTSSVFISATDTLQFSVPDTTATTILPITLDSLFVHTPSRFQLTARNANRGYAAVGAPCVHWKASGTGLYVNDLGLATVLGEPGDTAKVRLNGLRVNATLGTRIP